MKTIFVIIYIFISLNIYSQTGKKNIYYECLLNHIENKVSNEIIQRDKIITDTVYIQQSDFVSEIPDRMNGMNVKIVDNEIIYKKTSNKKAITVIKINPIVFIEEGALINIVTFGISRKRKHYININNGFTRYLIDYDCNNSKYTYKVKSSH